MNPNQPVQNPLAAMRQNEVEIFKIRRHPIGLIGVQLTSIIILAGLAGICFGILPSVLSDMDHARVAGIGLLAFIISAGFIGVFLLIVHKVYWGNAWILTTDSLTQMTQTTLFNNQHSQLSLHNLEDVTAEQNGILAHMFNFGVLKVETAGERSKFQFPYCPNPNYYAQQILQAREDFEQGLRDGYGQAPAAAGQAQTPPQQ